MVPSIVHIFCAHMVPFIVRCLHCAHILCTCAIVFILTGFLLLILLRQQISNGVNLHNGVNSRHGVN